MSGNSGDAEFDAFNDGVEIQVGQIEVVDDGKAPEEKPASRGPLREEQRAASAGNADDDDGGDDQDGADDEDQDGEDEKPRKTPTEHQIDRLKREKRDLQRQIRELAGGVGTSAIAARLEALETRLTGGNGADTKSAGQKAAPDPSDATKYPLGHLDDRYIEDKLEWLADQKATAQADAVLQRQQELERDAAAERFRESLLTQVEELSAKGSDLYPDFQEEVVETGMRGDWDLSQPTFEAAAEAENGAQILYELSQDKKEARRVARLTPYQQLKFVQERDAAISGEKKPRTKPQAGDPPRSPARGASSRTRGNPATDDLDDFEKQWEREAKGK